MVSAWGLVYISSSIGIGYSIHNRALYNKPDPECNYEPFYFYKSFPTLWIVGKEKWYHMFTTSHVGGEGTGVEVCNHIIINRSYCCPFKHVQISSYMCTTHMLPFLDRPHPHILPCMEQTLLCEWSLPLSTEMAHLLWSPKMANCRMITHPQKTLSMEQCVFFGEKWCSGSKCMGGY